MSRLKLAVMISGRGSNLQALIDACADPAYPAEIILVLSNRPDAQGLARAATAGIPTRVIDHKEFADRTSFDREMTKAMETAETEMVCLAGFMRLLSGHFLQQFPQRVLNIHPSLLPSFPGLHAHEQVLEYGVRVSGCTVHLVTEDMDAGPIVAQAAVPIEFEDDAESLAARVLEQEHRIYPEAVRLLAEGRLQVVGRRVWTLARQE